LHKKQLKTRANVMLASKNNLKIANRIAITTKIEYQL